MPSTTDADPDIQKLRALNDSEHQAREDETRGIVTLHIVDCFVGATFFIIVVGVAAYFFGFCQFDLPGVLTAFGSFFGSTLGFVLGYYFKSSDRGD